MIKKSISRGFNLVEIAVVLVIFGLLIGGVLRGQELINSAKARHLIDQKSSFQTAFIAFSNRFKMMAGDLTDQQAAFVGNGVVASNSKASIAGDGRINFNDESILVFQNLTATSLLACANCMNVTKNGDATPDNTFINSYSQSLRFGNGAPSADGISWYETNAAQIPAQSILATGSKVPAAILQQVDQKADDGRPNSGFFRQSTTDNADSTANCTTKVDTPAVEATATTAAIPATTTITWAATGRANCAGAWLF